LSQLLFLNLNRFDDSYTPRNRAFLPELPQFFAQVLPKLIVPGKPHRYFFKVYALDAKLELRAGAKRDELEMSM
jgi:phosphatidylethanolamine-binding protein (PEBP) family uncharacterized protein